MPQVGAANLTWSLDVETAAALADVNYTAGYLLDRPLIEARGNCEYIREQHNVITMGSIGSGKTYLGYALGMEARKQGFTVK